MIDFILNDKGEPDRLACNCDRAAVKPNLTRYITNRIQKKSFGTIEEKNLEGLCCGYCKATILQYEIEQKLKELDEAKNTKK